MNNHKNKKPEASEEEYLRYFFENANVSVQERIFLEEGFELCYNGRVPESLKIDLSKEEGLKVKDKDTVPCPPPASSSAPTPVISVPIIDLGLVEDEDIQIPPPPKMPELKMMGKVLLDKAEKGDYVLMHKRSGEHVSLGSLIDQLKEMTGVE